MHIGWLGTNVRRNAFPIYAPVPYWGGIPRPHATEGIVWPRWLADTYPVGGQVDKHLPYNAVSERTQLPLQAAPVGTEGRLRSLQ